MIGRKDCNVKLTIGLPVYNADRFLKYAIRSILNQSYSNFKLIIIDDGSTDNSIDIIKSFEDKRIQLISDGLNLGLPARLNQIAELTDTKYLARMDSDDVMHPDRMKIQIELMEENPEIDVLGTNAFSIDEDNNIQGVKLKADINEPSLYSCTSFIHPSIIAKTAWFKSNSYDVKAIRVEDVELWYRTRKHANFQCYTQPLLFYREFGSKYYRKYFKGIPSMFYLVGKFRSLLWLYVAIRFMLKGMGYWMAYLFKKEDVLIRRRSYEMEKAGVDYELILYSAINIKAIF